MEGHFEQQIRRRAYELWFQGGMADGHDRDHWHKAERELTMQHEHASPKKPARAVSRAKASGVAAEAHIKKAPARRKAAGMA